MKLHLKVLAALGKGQRHEKADKIVPTTQASAHHAGWHADLALLLPHLTQLLLVPKALICGSPAAFQDISHVLRLQDGTSSTSTSTLANGGS